MSRSAQVRIAFWISMGILLAAGLGGFSAMEFTQDFRWAADSSPRTTGRERLLKTDRISPLARWTEFFRSPDVLPVESSSVPKEGAPIRRSGLDRTKIPEIPLDPLSPPAKPVLIRDLKLAPYVLDRLREEFPDEFPKTENPAGGGSVSSGSGTGTRKETLTGRTSEALEPWSYVPYLFLPGLMMSGKPIMASPVDLNAIAPIVTGPPDYSLDTKVAVKGRLLSLGNGGVLVLEVVGGYVTDEDGPDFVIFGDQFVYKTAKGLATWAETAQVSVADVDEPSAYRTFPCDSTNPPYTGCAGVNPVRYSASMPLTDVGGDLFDLSTVGLSRIRFIRIEDTGENPSFSEGTEGFDLDAVGLIHTAR